MGSSHSTTNDGSHAVAAPRAKILCEKAAWKIAMAWQRQLRGAVWLVADPDGPVASIVEKGYAWVAIDISLIGCIPMTTYSTLEWIDQASIARAAAVGWLTLSQCPGYGSTENPVFWRKVFRGFAIPRWNPLPKESVGFFDQPGVVFPRFIIVTQLGHPVRLFCGVSNYKASPRISRKLKRLLHRLRPFAVDGTQSVDVGRDYSSYANFIQEVNASVARRVTPLFKITEIKFAVSKERDRDHLTRATYESLRSIPIRVGSLHYSPSYRPRTALEQAQSVGRLLGIDGHNFLAKPTTLVFPEYGMWLMVESIASGLPFTQSAHTTKISRRMDMSRDLAWLAYAIFHPEMKNSPWRNIVFAGREWTPHAVAVLAAMAQGNNLLPVLNGKPATSNAYYSAHLPSGTIVKTCGGLFAGSTTVVSEPEGRLVDVCGVSSLDRKTWGERVAVIVPLYGLGWVQTKDLQEVRARPPGCGLTGLTVSATFNGVHEMPTVLRSLGSQLVYLNIQIDGNYFPADPVQISSSTLQQVLQSCPQLKSLVVDHDGEYWSSRVVESDPSCHSRLEELELSISRPSDGIKLPSIEHLKSSLCQFRALRVDEHYSYNPNVVTARQAALERFLSHAHHLRYIHWKGRLSDGQTTRKKKSSHSKNQDSSLDRAKHVLMELGLSRELDERLLFAQAPIGASCAAAFLSVTLATSQSTSCSSSPSAPLIEMC